MGYKLAGCDVIAANDIDPEMAWHYKRNLHPKHYFLCPIKDLITASLPPELFSLDILDGSPPCSTFSIAGSREKSWGKDKHFREGQAKQVLSDLFFDYLDLVERIRPRVAIAENVKGMILGNAKGYTKMVMARFQDIGYRPQLFLLNSADCGVPQRRERVFFCAVRDDVSSHKLHLSPTARWVSASESTSDLQLLTHSEQMNAEMTKKELEYWMATDRGSNFSKACKKATGRESWFSRVRLDGSVPSATLTGNHNDIKHWDMPRRLTFREWKRLGSFPDDYEAKSERIGAYMVGMSVPPKMTEQVARAVCTQWLGCG